jgi:hypothetical protein
MRNLKLLLLGAVTTIVIWGIGHSFWAKHQDTVRTQNCQGVTMVINDSTQAICAQLKANKTELAALREAAKKMNGDLVAGVKIVVKRDTVEVPSTVAPTATLPDSTRVATKTDTTENYIVTITGKARPYPAPLELGARVITPERTAQIGFVNTPNGVMATVSGKGIVMTSAFWAPPKERPLTIVAGAEMSSNLLTPMDLTTLRASGYAALRYRMSDRWASRVEVGYRDRPYAALKVERKIW